MLFWMRRQSMGLRGELHAAIDRALSGGTAWGLAVLAFTAVIREGLETSLFLVGQATSAAAGASSVLLGAVIGLALAVGVGWIFYTGSRRVDLRAFFKWTGIALVFIAAGLLSKGIHEFIEVGVIPFGAGTAYDISRTLSQEDGIGQFLRAIFGYSANPEVLTLGAHLAYLVAVLALYLRPVRPRRGNPPARTPASEPSQAA
jgi:high-affinity iron transporter